MPKFWCLNFFRGRTKNVSREHNCSKLKCCYYTITEFFISAIPTLLAALVLLFCGNFQNALQGRQTLLPPQLYTSLTLLFIIIAFHVLAIMVTVTILCKHRRVGYEPCRNDNGKVKQVKHTLEIVVPLIVISDVFLLSLTMFVAKWTVQWIWAIIIINLIIAAWTIKVGLWAVSIYILI